MYVGKPNGVFYVQDGKMSIHTKEMRPGVKYGPVEYINTKYFAETTKDGKLLLYY